MTNPRATILLCQPSDFQRWVWQRILISQNLAAILVSSETNLRHLLGQIKPINPEMPHLILVDRHTPGFQPELFCRWCLEEYPQFPVMLLEGVQTEILHQERQGAIAYGAIDLLPAFQPDNLALKGIAGIKKVLSALGGLPIHNDSLVSCLLALKQDVETDQPLSPLNPEAASLNQASLDQSPLSPEPAPTLQPIPSPGDRSEESADKSRHKRVYRGRVY